MSSRFDASTEEQDSGAPSRGREPSGVASGAARGVTFRAKARGDGASSRLLGGPVHRHGPGCDHRPGSAHGAVRAEGGWVATLGTVSGVVCLIHCVLTPFLLSAVTLLPSLGLLARGNLERYLVGFTLLMAWSSVVISYRSHGRRLALYLLMAGTFLSSVSQLLPDATGLQTVLSLSGTAFLVSSIWVNRAHIRRGPIVAEASLRQPT